MPTWIPYLLALVEFVAIVGVMALLIHFSRSERQALLHSILFAFSLLLGVWVLDNTLAHSITLLSEGESTTLFSLVKDALLLVFGFYFGSHSRNEK